MRARLLKSISPIVKTSKKKLPSLLIVDDDEEIRTQMRWTLASDYRILQAEDRPSAMKVFRAESPAVVLLDLGLPPHAGTPEEGLATLAEIQSIAPRTKVVVISGQSEKSIALQTIGEGAYDFLGKPVDTDELELLVKRCFKVADLEKSYLELKSKEKRDAFEGMMGQSSRMQKVFSSISKVAPTDASVLILGESGTGKELTARAIHQRSARKHNPFIAINCSAIPESLMESELFGHEKGSFTGANQQRIGHIESADGGTLMLDEVGEIPLPVQIKLLRFLQEQTIQRVGGNGEIKLDVRVIAATNVNLTDGMESGSFREDLYYRLAVVKLLLPALREREEDLMILANTFLKSYVEEFGKSGLLFGAKAIKAIQEYSWPGNVRELQNRIRRAAIMGENKRLSPADLELTLEETNEPIETLKQARERLEKEIISNALRRNAGKMAGAAKELGISRPTLYELIEKLDIER